MRIPPLSFVKMVLPAGSPPDPGALRERLAPFAARVPEPEGGSGHATRPEAWCQGWRTPEGDEILLSLDRFRPDALAVAAVVAGLSPAEMEQLQAARWEVTVTSRLDAADPLAAYGRQLRFGSWACPDAVAVHDVSSTRVLRAEHVHEVATWRAAPPADLLYHAHAVFPGACGDLGPGGCLPRGAPEAYWIHTHGLQRAGFPDVEMLRVPEAYVTEAADVISTFVRSRMGAPLPIRGETDDTFRDVSVAWVPARHAAKDLRPGEPGGLGDRGGPRGHDGRRIAIVAADRDGRRWGPPIDLLRHFASGRGAARVPDRESERAAALARERWDLFAALFAEHARDERWEFHVCLPAVTGGGGREYLWWEALEVGEDGLLARLVSDPIRPGAVAAGDQRRHDLAAVTDWVARGPDREVHPASPVRRDRDGRGRARAAGASTP